MLLVTNNCYYPPKSLVTVTNSEYHPESVSDSIPGRDTVWSALGSQQASAIQALLLYRCLPGLGCGSVDAPLLHGALLCLAVTSVINID